MTVPPSQPPAAIPPEARESLRRPSTRTHARRRSRRMLERIGTHGYPAPDGLTRVEYTCWRRGAQRRAWAISLGWRVPGESDWWSPEDILRWRSLAPKYKGPLPVPERPDWLDDI